MSMAMVVIVSLIHSRSSGTVATIIQRKTLTLSLLSSIFYFNILLGLLTGIVIFFCAPIFSFIYQEPRIIHLLQLMSAYFIITSTSLVMRGLIQRDMRFDRLAFIEITTNLLGGGISVWMALNGYGVYSLVYGLLISSTINTLLLWFSVSWKPQLIFHWSELVTIFHFSLHLTGSQIIHYIMFNMDRIIIGRFLGATSLGYYDLAQRIFMIPIRNVTYALRRVLFPGFSKIQRMICKSRRNTFEPVVPLL